jgi:hypothetical protein
LCFLKKVASTNNWLLILVDQICGNFFGVALGVCLVGMAAASIITSGFVALPILIPLAYVGAGMIYVGSVA